MSNLQPEASLFSSRSRWDDIGGCGDHGDNMFEQQLKEAWFRVRSEVQGSNFQPGNQHVNQDLLLGTARSDSRPQRHLKVRVLL